MRVKIAEYIHVYKIIGHASIIIIICTSIFLNNNYYNIIYFALHNISNDNDTERKEQTLHITACAH